MSTQLKRSASATSEEPASKKAKSGSAWLLSIEILHNSTPVRIFSTETALDAYVLANPLSGDPVGMHREDSYSCARYTKTCFELDATRVMDLPRATPIVSPHEEAAKLAFDEAKRKRLEARSNRPVFVPSANYLSGRC